MRVNAVMHSLTWSLSPIRIGFLTVALATLSPVPALSSPSNRCTLDGEDGKWTEDALLAWQKVERDDLKLEPAPLPWIVLYDKTCVWNLKPAAPGRLRGLFKRRVPNSARGIVHGGRIQLPDGETITPSLVSFASTYGKTDPLPYLVMALPSVWRDSPRHRGKPDVDLLATAVFIHEMTHTRQTRVLGLRIGDLAARLGLGDDFDDDIVQDRFGGQPGFREAWEIERDLLFQTANEPSFEKRALLASRAVAAIKDRRSRFFPNGERGYAGLEQTFLDMEGLANWAAFRAVARSGKSRDQAIAFMRGKGNKWSQDEGFALFLALDALAPGWQPRIFAPSPASVLELLEEAVKKN